MEGNFLYAILLTAGAGLSTGLGGLVSMFVKKPGPKFMGFTLGFSAGVMILISFVEMLQEGIEEVGFLWANAAFVLGMCGIFLIDYLVPHEYIGQHDHPNGNKLLDKKTLPYEDDPRLKRTGIMVAFGIAIHNFPEGIAVFVGALHDIRLGLAIAIAIAIHNIPEGVAVASPIYAVTGNRKKAFMWAFASGLAEPLGALVAALFLMPFLNEAVLGVTLAAVGGIMVAIAMDELAPSAKAYGSEHAPIIGVIVGIVIMSGSLWALMYFGL